MDSFSWKRTLFPATYPFSTALKEIRGSQHATRVTGTEKLMPTKETSSAVVSQQTPEDDFGNGKFYLFLNTTKFVIHDSRSFVFNNFGWGRPSSPSHSHGDYLP